MSLANFVFIHGWWFLTVSESQLCALPSSTTRLVQMLIFQKKQRVLDSILLSVLDRIVFIPRLGHLLVSTTASARRGVGRTCKRGGSNHMWKYCPGKSAYLPMFNMLKITIFVKRRVSVEQPPPPPPPPPPHAHLPTPSVRFTLHAP